MTGSTDVIEDDTVPLAVRRTARELLPAMYADLRRLARIQRLRVGADDTMQTTALIHETWLRLRNSPAFNDQAHFLRSAALAMRQTLINYARDSVAAKRGGGAVHLGLEAADSVAVTLESDEQVLAVHEALKELARLSERLTRVVECRFFAGYDEEETAQALGLTSRTVRRDWVKARAWLRVTLSAAEK